LVEIDYSDITAILNNLINDGLNFIKIENLYAFDGVRGYSLGQGE
jgi:isocitrate dehydrogenase